MEHFYQSITGWMDFEKVYSDQVKLAQDGSIFIEIGTANGRSAAFMAVEIFNSGKKIEFHTVDIFPPENQKYLQEENARKYLKPFSFAHVHKSDSLDFLNKQKDNSIDFIFIDGKHEYYPLIFELMEAQRIVKPGGYIGGHDYWTSFPDVKKSVDKFCQLRNYKVEVIDKSYLFQI